MVLRRERESSDGVCFIINIQFEDHLDKVGLKEYNWNIKRLVLVINIIIIIIITITATELDLVIGVAGAGSHLAWVCAKS